MKEKYNEIDSRINRIKTTVVEVDDRMKAILNRDNAEVEVRGRTSIDKLLKRPEVSIKQIHEIMNENFDDNISPIIEMEIKYEGYIARDAEKIRKMEKMESKSIPSDIDYKVIQGLKNEAREKLIKVQPATIGQALRISGVDPSDVSILLVYLETLARRQKDVPRGT
jgi:tRNA uridine 5-carboxymethylaminomethyl modification enzyme